MVSLGHNELNVNKTNLIVFASQNKKGLDEKPNISIENHDILPVYKTFLGVVIDSKPHWRSRIYYIANGI